MIINIEMARLVLASMSIKYMITSNPMNQIDRELLSLQAHLIASSRAETGNVAIPEKLVETFRMLYISMLRI